MAIYKGAAITAGISLLLLVLAKHFDYHEEGPLPEKISNWQKNGKYADVNGHRMFYHQAGKIDEEKKCRHFLTRVPNFEL